MVLIIIVLVSFAVDQVFFFQKTVSTGFAHFSCGWMLSVYSLITNRHSVSCKNPSAYHVDLCNQSLHKFLPAQCLILVPISELLLSGNLGSPAAGLDFSTSCPCVFYWRFCRVESGNLRVPYFRLNPEKRKWWGCVAQPTNTVFGVFSVFILSSYWTLSLLYWVWVSSGSQKWIIKRSPTNVWARTWGKCRKWMTIDIHCCVLQCRWISHSRPWPQSAFVCLAKAVKVKSSYWNSIVIPFIFRHFPLLVFCMTNLVYLTERIYGSLKVVVR